MMPHVAPGCAAAGNAASATAASTQLPILIPAQFFIANPIDRCIVSSLFLASCRRCHPRGIETRSVAAHRFHACSITPARALSLHAAFAFVLSDHLPLIIYH
jgi:hypothetical protein